MADPASRAGKSAATPAIIARVEAVHAAPTAAERTAFEAPERHGMPAIQLGASESKLLALLLGLVGAKRVVEIGTLAGYSALRMARGMPNDGRLWTLENDPEHARIARQNIAAAGLPQRIEVIEGDALVSLSRLAAQGPFDVVFLDADKAGYPAYGRWAFQHLRSGGLLIADNAYLFGELLEGHATAQAMREFHEQTALAFESVCIPTPDGLVVARRP